MIFCDEKGQWRWRYDASPNEPVFQSERGYSTVEECRRSIWMMKEHRADEVWFGDVTRMP